MTNGPHRTQEENPPEEQPPFGRSWATLYAAVLIFLALLIAIFYAFTKAFE